MASRGRVVYRFGGRGDDLSRQVGLDAGDQRRRNQGARHHLIRRVGQFQGRRIYGIRSFRLVGKGPLAVLQVLRDRRIKRLRRRGLCQPVQAFQIGTSGRGLGAGGIRCPTPLDTEGRQEHGRADIADDGISRGQKRTGKREFCPKFSPKMKTATLSR